MKTAIFVDIDGVFHSTSAGTVQIVGTETYADGPDLFMWAPVLWSVIQDHVVDIVVHSSWRHQYSFDDLLERFPAQMRHRITGVTVGGDRYQSILDYVEQHAIERFAILDDLAGAFPKNCPHLILCDGDVGLSDPIVQDKVRQFLECRPG